MSLGANQMLQSKQKSKMTIMQDIKNTESRIQEKDKQILAVEDLWDQAFENWQKNLISAEQMDQQEDVFRNQLRSLVEECRILHDKLTELKQAAKTQAVIESIELENYGNSMWQDLQPVSDQDDSMDGQEPTMINSEPTINIESEIDNKKSDEQMHQIIESIETENYVDNLLQVQQQQKPHHQTVGVVTIETIIQVQQSAQPQAPQQQQPKSSDSPIKMVDNIKRQGKFEQNVIIEIEGNNVELCRLQVRLRYAGSRADRGHQGREIRHIQRRHGIHLHSKCNHVIGER